MNMNDSDPCEDIDHINEFSIIINRDPTRLDFRRSSTSWAIFRTGLRTTNVVLRGAPCWWPLTRRLARGCYCALVYGGGRPLTTSNHSTMCDLFNSFHSHLSMQLSRSETWEQWQHFGIIYKLQYTSLQINICVYCVLVLVIVTRVRHWSKMTA